MFGDHLNSVPLAVPLPGTLFGRKAVLSPFRDGAECRPAEPTTTCHITGDLRRLWVRRNDENISGGCWRTLVRRQLTLPSSLRMISELGIHLEGSTASGREKGLAATDVRCQLDSGYRKALYDAEWERQTSVPKADAEQFKSVGDAIAQNRRTVLAELAALPSTR